MQKIMTLIAAMILTAAQTINPPTEMYQTEQPIDMYRADRIVEMYPMDEEAPQETPQEAPEATEETQAEEIPTETLQGQYEATTLPVTFYGGVSQARQDLYWAYAAYEPQQVIDTLNAYGVIIQVAPDARFTAGACGTCTFRHLMNGYDRGYIEIGINAKSDDSVAISVNHEIGHALDEIIGMQAGFAQTSATYNPYPTMTISNSPEFQAIYAAERPTAGYPSWNSQNTLEWFAETYRYVVEHNETMRQRAPRSYEWVRTTVNAYLGTNL